MNATLYAAPAMAGSSGISRSFAFGFDIAVINGAILILSSFVLMFAGGLVFRVHSRWFAMPRETFNALIYGFLGFYKVIFMRRNLHEVLASQAKMLDRRGESSETSDDEMIKMFESHLEKVQFQLRFRPWFDALYLDHRSVLSDPAGAARKINEFLGGKLDERRMAEAVDPNLYRNRAENLEAAKRAGA